MPEQEGLPDHVCGYELRYTTDRGGYPRAFVRDPDAPVEIQFSVLQKISAALRAYGITVLQLGGMRVSLQREGEPNEGQLVVHDQGIQTPLSDCIDGDGTLSIQPGKIVLRDGTAERTLFPADPNITSAFHY